MRHKKVSLTSFKVKEHTINFSLVLALERDYVDNWFKIYQKGLDPITINCQSEQEKLAEFKRVSDGLSDYRKNFVTR